MATITVDSNTMSADFVMYNLVFGRNRINDDHPTWFDADDLVNAMRRYGYDISRQHAQDKIDEWCDIALLRGHGGGYAFA